MPRPSPVRAQPLSLGQEEQPDAQMPTEAEQSHRKVSIKRVAMQLPVSPDFDSPPARHPPPPPRKIDDFLTPRPLWELVLRDHRDKNQGNSIPSRFLDKQMWFFFFLLSIRHKITSSPFLLTPAVAAPVAMPSCIMPRLMAQLLSPTLVIWCCLWGKVINWFCVNNWLGDMPLSKRCSCFFATPGKGYLFKAEFMNMNTLIKIHMHISEGLFFKQTIWDGGYKQYTVF